MARKPEAVDNLLDALVWMRRKAKEHEAVDDLIDALMKMRRNVKKKAVIRKRKTNERKRKEETGRRSKWRPPYRGAAARSRPGWPRTPWRSTRTWSSCRSPSAT